MDREILFRGKRVDNGEWIYGDRVRSHTKTYIVTCGEAFPDEVYPETVGQFTGLTDKNGEKIFESDIVDILCENEEIGVIEWEKDTAQFIVSADGFCASFDNYSGHDLEVIGNIHDNPEMLREGIV